MYVLPQLLDLFLIYLFKKRHMRTVYITCEICLVNLN